MPRTPFDKVTPEYRNAIPGNHWMGVCHPYFIPNQPPPAPCCPGAPAGAPAPHIIPRPCCPALDHAPVPCGMVGGRDTRPVINPAAGRTVALPSVPLPKAPPAPCPGPGPARPVPPSTLPATSVTGTGTPVAVHPLMDTPNPYINPVDYDSNVQAPHPKIYWLAKRDVSVVAGENTDVEEIVTPSTGDKTYVVSAKAPESEKRRIDELERQVEAELAEIRRIKENMLSVEEDGFNGVQFGLGME